jgi:hypothetical protein
MAAIAAAAVATAGHPDSEVAYDPDGKPVGASSVDIAVRIVTIAKTLETFINDAPEGLVAQAKASGAKATAKAKAAPSQEQPEELERIPVDGEDFNPDVCPIHGKAEDGTFDTDMRPLYCEMYKDQKCEWQRKDFTNTDDDTGERTFVTKYRIVKGKGTFMKLDAYKAELRRRNLLV